jgi:phosphoribosylaminoimidazolecarboxamide formyltransferase/IMP cyclohydrolase
MGTDSFFPFPDGLEAAVDVGAKAIINPGGSIRDDVVIKRADELNCALVFCGKRVFRH